MSHRQYACRASKRSQHRPLTQIPPIAIPNNDLTAKNCWYVLQNDDPSSNMAINNRLMTNVHFLPYRSAATPKMTAPTDRKRRVRVMAVVISVELLPNCTERRLAEIFDTNGRCMIVSLFSERL